MGSMSDTSLCTGVQVFTRTKWTLVDSTIRQLSVIRPKEQSTQEQNVEAKRISTTSALGALQARPLFLTRVVWQEEQTLGVIMELSTGRQRRQSRVILEAAFPKCQPGPFGSLAAR